LSEQHKPPRKLNLLIVEDEPGDFRLLQLAVQKNGFEAVLHSAVNAGEALAFLRREGEANHHAPRPDLILLDLNLPGMTGLELLAQIKADKRLFPVPVVIITSSGSEADVCAAYRCGAAGYVVKPADLNEFVVAIHDLGQYWFRLVRLPEQFE
jgi:CheY-like chemotaxis protein